MWKRTRLKKRTAAQQERRARKIVNRLRNGRAEKRDPIEFPIGTLAFSLPKLMLPARRWARG